MDEEPDINIERLHRHRAEVSLPPRKPEEVLQLVERILKHSIKDGPKKKRRFISKGSLTTKDGTNYVLVRPSIGAESVYFVNKKTLDISRALFRIDLVSGATFDSDSVAPYSPQSAITVLRKLNEAVLEHLKGEREQKQGRRKVTRTIAGSLVGAIVAGGGIYAIVQATRNTDEAIRSDQVYAPDTRPQPLKWSDQYEGKDVASFSSDTEHDEDKVATDAPSEIDTPYGTFLDKCDTYTRKIEAGDRFRAVFHGQTNDGFTIEINDINNQIKICRTSGDSLLDGLDKVYIQRVQDQ